MSRIRLLALGWVVLVIGLLAVHIFLPQRSGVLALTQVFEPYIVLTGLVACVFAVRVPGAPAKIAVAVLVVASLLRYVPGWLSFPGPGVGTELGVMTWNLELGGDAGERALEALRKTDAGLVGLQELQPAAAAAIQADADMSERWPNRVLAPEGGSLGIGLLSTYPILESQTSADPPMIRAVVAPEVGDPFVVFVIHPLPADFGTIAGIPVSIETTERDTEISYLRSLIDQDLDAGRSVIVMGDINTTEREPAYADLSAGLIDAHRDAGLGPGLTWRPDDLAFLPFGLLRIDYVFASPPFVIWSTFTDCSLRSDHCRLEATIFLGTQL